LVNPLRKKKREKREKKKKERKKWKKGERLDHLHQSEYSSSFFCDEIINFLNEGKGEEKRGKREKTPAIVKRKNWTRHSLPYRKR